MGADRAFAVVDVETTGFSPRHHHRVIEIGIVRLNPLGEVEEEYDTLVNPNRDLGPTQVHGIRPRHLKNAPEFREIAGDVLSLLGNSVFVAHNVRFDYAFVESELGRAGVSLGKLPALCTMALAGEFATGGSCRKLSAICKNLGIAVDRQHMALSDARASAAILARYLKLSRHGKCRPLADILELNAPVRNQWPQLPRSQRRCPRSAVLVPVEEPPRFMAQVVERLPSYKDSTPATNSYLASLDEALSDRILTLEESADLQALAEDLGLLREQVEVVHRRYLKDLVSTALLDGKLTNAEQRDLQVVADLLSVGGHELGSMLQANGARSRESHDSQPGLTKRKDLHGLKVCFTGTFECNVIGYPSGRDSAEQLAREHGMIIKENVVKALDILVAADVDTMSSKARKAREYGIRIISETEYWCMLGLEVSGENC